MEAFGSDVLADVKEPLLHNVHCAHMHADFGMFLRPAQPRSQTCWLTASGGRSVDLTAGAFVGSSRVTESGGLAT